MVKKTYPQVFINFYVFKKHFTFAAAKKSYKLIKNRL